MIQGIFYARFMPKEGTKVVAQSPPGCIVASTFAPNTKPPLVDYDIVQEYIIPRKAFFNRFIVVTCPDYKNNTLLGFPVSIPNERYDRNEFIFNFGIVIEADVDQAPYEMLVRRLAATFAEMERLGGYLSNAEKADSELANDGRRPIQSLLEILKEDLNNYGECMIPVDDANTMNMKLFPYHAPPAPVLGWHVPVPKCKLADIMDPTWDLTLQKLVPFIDGVNDVRRIAWLADVSLPLTQIALQHLLYYDTILLLDMFFFGSCYAPRPGIHDFIANRDGVVEECANYVCTSPPTPPGAASSSAAAAPTSTRGTSTSTPSMMTPAALRPTTALSSSNIPNLALGVAPKADSGMTTAGRDDRPQSASQQQQQRVSSYQLIKIMTSFCVGRSVMEWIRLHQQEYDFDVLRHIDVRRLVQFGVIKGYLYRVHKYVVSKQYLALLATGQARPLRDDEDGVGATGSDAEDLAGTTVDGSNGAMERGQGAGGGGGAKAGVGSGGMADPLQRYTDGTHCFDQIITELNVTDAEIMEKIKGLEAPARDLSVFYR